MQENNGNDQQGSSGNQSSNQNQSIQGGNNQGGQQVNQQSGNVDPYDRGTLRDFERRNDDTPYLKKSS